MESSRGDKESVATYSLSSPLTLLQWKGFWFRSETVQGIQAMTTKFKPLQSDVIMASFPKAGTTWLKALLFSITNRFDPRAHSFIAAHNPHVLIPHIEIQFCSPFVKDYISFPGISSRTRAIATHVPYQILQDNVYSLNCPIVYIARNPKDTIISLWKFLLKLGVEDKEEVQLEKIVNDFCNGKVLFGPYYNHVLGYWRKSLETPEKVLFLTYEELRNDPITNVRRLAEFLKCPFKSEEEVMEVVKICSLEELKGYAINKLGSQDYIGIKVPNESFFREGKIDDYINYMTPEMIEKIDSLTKEKFHGLGFIYGL